MPEFAAGVPGEAEFVEAGANWVGDRSAIVHPYFGADDFGHGPRGGDAAFDEREDAPAIEVAVLSMEPDVEFAVTERKSPALGDASDGAGWFARHARRMIEGV